MREGWLLASHGNRRQDSFMSLLGTLPLPEDQLLQRRVPIIFDTRGSSEVIQDFWTDAQP